MRVTGPLAETSLLKRRWSVASGAVSFCLFRDRNPSAQDIHKALNLQFTVPHLGISNHHLIPLKIPIDNSYTRVYTNLSWFSLTMIMCQTAPVNSPAVIIRLDTAFKVARGYIWISSLDCEPLVSFR